MQCMPFKDLFYFNHMGVCMHVGNHIWVQILKHTSSVLFSWWWGHTPLWATHMVLWTSEPNIREGYTLLNLQLLKYCFCGCWYFSKFRDLALINIWRKRKILRKLKNFFPHFFNILHISETQFFTNFTSMSISF